MTVPAGTGIANPPLHHVRAVTIAIVRGYGPKSCCKGCPTRTAIRRRGLFPVSIWRH